MDKVGFHSKFGGLWFDRADWREQIAARKLSGSQARLIEQFAEDGYVILPQAAPLKAVDAFQQRIERSFREGGGALLYQAHGDSRTQSLDGPVDRLGTRIVNSFVALPEALELFSSPQLLEFLNLAFGEDPLLFQSLSFDQGSQQGLHQDTAYVVVNRPLELAACWIALEDVREGSGELMYAPGSHRLPDWTFGDGRKYWNADIDGRETHDRWSDHLRHAAVNGPRGIQHFLAKKGDILIWHADLAHGGAPVSNPALTRQSLVGHFCPQSAQPHYFSAGDRRDTVRRYGRLAYSSAHYDIPAFEASRDGVANSLADSDRHEAVQSGLRRLLNATRRAVGI